MLSVREVAKEFRVTPQTIRKWAKQGILIVDFRTPTNRLYFSEEQIKRKISVGGQSIET